MLFWPMTRDLEHQRCPREQLPVFLKGERGCFAFFLPFLLARVRVQCQKLGGGS